MLAPFGIACRRRYRRNRLLQSTPGLNGGHPLREYPAVRIIALRTRQHPLFADALLQAPKLREPQSNAFRQVCAQPHNRVPQSQGATTHLLGQRLKLQKRLLFQPNTWMRLVIQRALQATVIKIDTHDQILYSHCLSCGPNVEYSATRGPKANGSAINDKGRYGNKAQSTDDKGHPPFTVSDHH